MKYIRKITVYLISVIIMASLVIGCGIIFAVRNINITIMGYSDSAEESIPQIKTLLLSKFRGSVMLFVSEKQVMNAIDDGRYIVEECEKEYPCTLNVRLRERMETYYSENGESFSVYDDTGAVIRTASDKEAAVNQFDGSPNVKITGASGESDYKAVAAAGAAFREKFSSLRAVVSEITLSAIQSELGAGKLVFTLKSGLKIEIYDYETDIKEKISAAYSQFERRSGSQKQKGTIISYALIDGTVSATYNPN